MYSHLKRLFVLSILVLPFSVMGWSGVGHKVVAHIAYDHLTPEAKKAVDQLTQEDGNTYSARSRFVFGSTWADWSRARGDHRFRLWHYMDLPLAAQGMPTKPANPINAVYGINHCQVVLKNPQRPLEEQKTSLKLLVHLVGDIHQPLHAVNRFSESHPKGDRGGNSHRIQSATADNLHAYWDQGLGRFKPLQKRNATTGVRIRQYAEDIQERYPIEHYTNHSGSSEAPALQTKTPLLQTPIEWARESRRLSESFVYQLPEDSRPSKDYHAKGIQIMEERLALAGYRLAHTLNTLYNHTVTK